MFYENSIHFHAALLVCLLFLTLCTVPVYGAIEQPALDSQMVQVHTPALPNPATLSIALDFNITKDDHLKVDTKVFFRVSEEVTIDGAVIFGAGAFSNGCVQKIEKDSMGNIVAIEVELQQIQDVAGKQVQLNALRLYIPLTGIKNKHLQILLDVNLALLMEQIGA